MHIVGLDLLLYLYNIYITYTCYVTLGPHSTVLLEQNLPTSIKAVFACCVTMATDPVGNEAVHRDNRLTFKMTMTKKGRCQKVEWATDAHVVATINIYCIYIQ